MVEGISAAGRISRRIDSRVSVRSTLPAGFVAEGGVAVRDERSDTDHLGFELPDEKQIPDQIVHRLSRAADHDARTGLVADLFEGVQAFDAVIEGHPDGMEPTIVIGSDRFMPQQVTVRARFEQRPVGGFCPFPQREGDGAVGPAATHLPDQSGQQFVVQSRVFSALKYECPESQPVALFAAGQYGFRGQTVAFCQTIAASNAAVAAVVAAVIADFDQPPNENSVSEMHTATSRAALCRYSLSSGDASVSRRRNSSGERVRLRFN